MIDYTEINQKSKSMPRFANILVVVFVQISIFFGVALSSEVKEKKNILILYSEDRWHPAHHATEKGMLYVFESNTDLNISLHAENLNISEFYTSKNRKATADILRNRYAPKNIDLLITVYPDAADFIIFENPNLFLDVPMIAGIVTKKYKEKIDASQYRHMITGTIIGDSISHLMSEIFLLRPGTKHLALISGTAPNDIYGETLYRNAFIPYGHTIDLIDLTKLSMEETLSRVGDLPPDTVIFYESILRDAAGKEFVPRLVLSSIAKSANAPVFGPYDTYMGYGIVGGNLTSFEIQGRKIAGIALRVLKGESPDAIPFGGEGAYIRKYDARELRRWHISKKALPPGSIVLFEPHSIWKQHWKTFAIGILLFLAQGALITGLLINRQKRREFEKSLIESKQLTYALLKATHDIAHIIDEDGTIVDLNESMAETLGGVREELIGACVFDRVSKERAEHQKALINRVLDKGQPLRLEDIGDPSNRIYESHLYPIETDRGEKRRIALFARDITDRKNMEKELELIKKSIDACPDVAYWIDLEGKFVYVNNTACEVLGYSWEELMQMSVFDVAPYVAKERWGEIWKILRKDDKYISESVHRRKDDSEFPVEIISNRVVFNGKEYVNGFARDITERKKVEQALKESETRLNEAQRIAHIGSWELDLLADTFILSDEAYRIFEIDSERFSTFGQFYLDVVHPDDRAFVKEAYSESLVSKKPSLINHRLLMPDGRIKYLSTQYETFYSPEGLPLKTFGIIHDITELEKAAKESNQLRIELAHLNRVLLMNEVSGALAHEINQPLGAISNNAYAAMSLMSNNKEKNEEINEILKDIIIDSNRAGQIINNIRSLVKKQEPVMTSVNINDIINVVIRLFKKRLINNQVLLQMELDPDIQTISGSRIGLQQVLANLIANALEAMTESSCKKLKVCSAMRSPDKIIVSVTDSGKGIDEEIKEKLFSPFFSTKPDGLGIGLRICQTIIDEHGGQIWLENSTNGGATFCFFIKTD